MNRLYLLPFLLVASLTSFLFAQDAAEEVVEISTVEALLALLKRAKLKSKLQTTTEKINSLQIKINKLQF